MLAFHRYAPGMSRLLPPLLLLSCLSASMPAAARTMHARIAKVTTAVATLEGVEVQLDWPARATQGNLVLTARSVIAPDLGYRYANLRWQCPLRRDSEGWRCDGSLSDDGVRSGRGAPLRLSVDLRSASTDVALSRGRSTLAVHRQAAAPDDTLIDLTRVPLPWAQALLAQAWQAGRLKAGTLDGRLTVHAPSGQPLQVGGTLDIAGAALETPDATIAAENLGGRLAIDYRKTPQLGNVVVDGQLRGGEFLVGNAYVALPPTPVALRIEGRQRAGEGWQLPKIAWHDGNVLVADGSAGFDRDANLRDLDLHLHSSDASPLGARYLSGYLAQSGLSDLQLAGALDADIRVVDGRLQSADTHLQGIDLVDPQGRFRFEGLSGAPRFSAGGPVSGELRWHRGQLYGLDFGAAALPIDSRDGELRLRGPVSVPALGGSLRFDSLVLRPPAGDMGMRVQFGLSLDKLDIGALSKTLGWPAFQGTLSGSIPVARYAGERLDFDGGLTMQLFDGEVRISALSMERPFGVAPSLSADVALHDLDLQALTGVFDFGSITGRLEGRIDHLRLVDWTATAFDADLHTVPARGVKQRISQRAVQNISSVGDASFTNTLQSQLIGLFDDFGYNRIGISCRLANEVCEMGGLHSAGAGFTIVEGAGLPRLTVVGFNRQVDWPTLVERLAAVSKGDIKPVVE
jgi:hypothetical protein